MHYEHTILGRFQERPNRFIAKVWVDAGDLTEEEKRQAAEYDEKNDQYLVTVHVKNTGRCRELLFPDVQVVLEHSDNPSRKTSFDLIAVYKASLGWVNIDSQVPNKVVREWLETQDYTYIKPEYTYGASRVDFYMEKGEERYLLEIKGCTLEIDGIGYFPDAPTLRGVKHVREMTEAAKKGYHCAIGFVIAMEGVFEVRANVATHAEFGEALEDAKASGVEVWFLPCRVCENAIHIIEKKEG